MIFTAPALQMRDLNTTGTSARPQVAPEKPTERVFRPNERAYALPTGTGRFDEHAVEGGHVMFRRALGHKEGTFLYEKDRLRSCGLPKVRVKRGTPLSVADTVKWARRIILGVPTRQILVGNAFLKRWTDRSVGSLFTFVESQMPVGRRPHLICRRGPSPKETGDFKTNNSGRRDEGVLARGESFHLGRHDWGNC
jgi:hypothetical protein